MTLIAMKLKTTQFETLPCLETQNFQTKQKYWLLARLQEILESDIYDKDADNDDVGDGGDDEDDDVDDDVGDGDDNGGDGEDDILVPQLQAVWLEASL